MQNIVKEAILNHGYRAFDGAWIYRNENEVGNGIHEAIEESQGKIKREDLFITTKLWNQVGNIPNPLEYNAMCFSIMYPMMSNGLYAIVCPNFV